MIWQNVVRLNLLLVFDVYLVATFLVSILIRYQQYRTVVRLIRKLPERWPKLLETVRQERTLYLNWYTLLPVLAAFSVMLIHSGLVRFVWSSAAINIDQLLRHWLALSWIVVSFVLMVGMDFYMIFNITRLHVPTIEEELDRAEYWLTSKAGTVVKVVTFGYLNPKKMVKKEIRKAIATALQTMDRVVWLWLVQVGLRLMFGFSIWLLWLNVFRN